MTIDTTLLTTTVECDNLLALLQKEKVQLERRVRNLGEVYGFVIFVFNLLFSPNYKL